MAVQPVSYAAWPFAPSAQWTAAQAQLWQRTCYYSAQAEAILQGEAHWRLLVGGRGSGKTVTLEHLAHSEREAGQSLVVAYPLNHWPGTRGVVRPEANHLVQMMFAASGAVRRYLNTRPDKLEALSFTQREFVRWLFEKYGGARAFIRWLDSLPPELAEAFREVAYTDLYPTTTETLDIQGQVDELASLVRRLGFQRVLFTVDINESPPLGWLETPDLPDREPGEAGQSKLHLTLVRRLGELFEEMNLAHQAGLALLMALPASLMQAAALLERAQGRVSVARLEWDQGDMVEIASRHIRLALDSDTVGLDDFLSSTLQTTLGAFLAAEFGQPAPAAWVALAETILYLATRPNAAGRSPLSETDPLTIQRVLLERHMPLRVDKAGYGVWRGPRFIALSEAPLSLLEVLRRQEGQPISWPHPALRQIAGTHNNLHALVSRARERIEITPDDPVYVKSDRGQGGYWLANYV